MSYQGNENSGRPGWGGARSRSDRAFGAALRSTAAAVLLVWGACGCAQTGDDVIANPQAHACEVRLIVGFANGSGELKADALTEAAGAKIEIRSSIGPSMYAVDLTAEGSADACRSAVDRLKRMAGIRFVEPDSRRRAHAR
jgi:hypothetical protein